MSSSSSWSERALRLSGVSSAMRREPVRDLVAQRLVGHGGIQPDPGMSCCSLTRRRCVVPADRAVRPRAPTRPTPRPRGLRGRGLARPHAGAQLSRTTPRRACSRPAAGGRARAVGARRSATTRRHARAHDPHVVEHSRPARVPPTRTRPGAAPGPARPHARFVSLPCPRPASTRPTRRASSRLERAAPRGQPQLRTPPVGHVVPEQRWGMPQGVGPGWRVYVKGGGAGPRAPGRARRGPGRGGLLARRVNGQGPVPARRARDRCADDAPQSPRGMKPRRRHPAPPDDAMNTGD